MNLIGLIELLMLRKLKKFQFFFLHHVSLNAHNSVLYMPATCIYTNVKVQNFEMRFTGHWDL